MKKSKSKLRHTMQVATLIGVLNLKLVLARCIVYHHIVVDSSERINHNYPCLILRLALTIQSMYAWQTTCRRSENCSHSALWRYWPVAPCSIRPDPEHLTPEEAGRNRTGSGPVS